MGGQRRRGASLSCPPFAIASAALWSSACPRTSRMSGVCEGLGEGEGSAASAVQVGFARASLQMRGGSDLGTVAGQKWNRSQMPQCPLQNAPASRLVEHVLDLDALSAVCEQLLELGHVVLVGGLVHLGGVRGLAHVLWLVFKIRHSLSLSRSLFLLSEACCADVCAQRNGARKSGGSKFWPSP